jgi:predicted NAD-dependent protein-ADP-ribosyltransferase YbiA (DUF1768 family)
LKEKNEFYAQRYPSNIVENSIKYSCNEQYMMAHKALLFKDSSSYEKIMKTQSPAIQKQL